MRTEYIKHLSITGLYDLLDCLIVTEGFEIMRDKTEDYVKVMTLL